MFLILCCFNRTLLTFQGSSRMGLLVMLTTLPCFVEFHILGRNDDLSMISDWCSRWGMLVNPNKTRGMLISRSREVEPLFLDLVIDCSVVEMVSELKILGVIDSKLAFEKQVRAIADSASRKVGILRKTIMSVFRDIAVVAKRFWSFILPVLEYCFTVWMSAATSYPNRNCRFAY